MLGCSRWPTSPECSGHVYVYVALGALLWVAVLESGVHATVAGVLLTIPAHPRIGGDERPQQRP